jgi:hypothetical protein
MQIRAPPTGLPTLSLFGRGEIIIFCRRACVMICMGKSGSNDWHVFMIFWEGKEELAKILGE